MPKITVGIPAYKTRFLVEAISSVLAQTFTDFDLLVSDDSADGAAGDIVRRFQDPRIRLIEGPRQGLVANSVNIWDNASADLLKFLYDDDFLFPTALEELAALIGKDPKFTFAASRRVIVDEFGRVVRRPVTYQTDDWMWFEPAQLANHLVRTISNPLGEPSNFLIRRSAFEDSSCLSRFAGLPITHLIDVAFMLNAAQRGPCAATGKYLSAFRQHADQVSSRSTAPEFALGVLEWEVCLRGAVELGLVSPHTALDGVPRLEGLYRRYGAPSPEIQQFFYQLPALKELLGAGARQVLTTEFRADLQRAEVAVKSRAAAAATAPPATAEAEDGASETPHRVRANLDSLTRRGARGWAWIPDQPEQVVHVEAVVGNRVVGHAVADQQRSGLKDWNLGTGNYGFEIRFYEPLLGDEPPRFRFFAEEEWFAGETRLPPAGPGGMVRREGAEAPLLEHARFTAPGPDFEEFNPARLTDRPRRQDGPDPLLVAFYLPQFHAIPENDWNWGRGFTEWRQLPKGIPRFPGHYQPRVPRDLGFYDLLDEDVIERQSRMAKAAGVGAFAFYYYWFNRKRVLDRPVEIFLGSKIEMPFLIVWANENWTRGWDGLKENVLLEQDYDREDEDALLADLARHMRDHRYVHIDGRPLFVIYNPNQIPDTARTLARWRQKWSDIHGLRPLIFMAQAFEREDPRPYGLDGALEFPPHKLAARSPRREVFEAFSNEFASQVIAYDAFVNASVSEPAPGFPLIKTLVPSWDNEPRRPNRGLVLYGSTPRKYEAWLEALVGLAMERPVYGAPIVGINAWNEWAEGAYLEPDVHFGSAYLNATARALNAAIRKRNLAVQAPAPTSLPAPKRGARKRVLLHLGQHKTGTTSIQGALSDLRDHFSESGVLYPSTGCPEWAPLGHHLLPWSVLTRPETAPTLLGRRAEFPPGEADRLWDRLHDEIAASNADLVIISSEEFDVLNAAEIAALRVRLERYDVTPVLFTRRTSALVESNYRTEVIHLGYGRSIRDFVREGRARTDVRGLVRDWRAVAGDGQLVVLSYDDPEIRRDAVRSFFKAVGLDAIADAAPPPPPTTPYHQLRQNQSLPAFVCEVTRYLRQLQTPEEKIMAFLDQLGDGRLLVEAGEKTSCLPPDLGEALDAVYAGDVTALKEDPATAGMLHGAFDTAPHRPRGEWLDGPAAALLALGREIARHNALRRSEFTLTPAGDLEAPEVARAADKAISHGNGTAQPRKSKVAGKVSVICPCFNHSQFLPDRLRTIINQTHRPDEIIFLDDASSDDSVAVARALLEKSGIEFKIIVNPKNSGNVFAQWVKGLELARNDLVWIAETDDAADLYFLEKLAPRVTDEVLVAFARIQCLDENGLPRDDLRNYYDSLTDFSWTWPKTVPAYRAFTGDFAVKNVIPNVSAAVFRRPRLSKTEVDRLLSYSFAGDWYFYMRVLRGGAVAYLPEATSYFRVRGSSVSRDALLTERHLEEHRMILEDIEATYGLSDETLPRHASELAALFPSQPVEEMSRRLRPPSHPDRERPLRICIAALSFAVGGGEIAPIQIANAFSRRGHHVTYLVLEDTDLAGGKHVRERLNHNIGVFRWNGSRDNFEAFVRDYGIQVLNSHNIAIDYQLHTAGVQTMPPYVASLHGGYESTPECLTPDFMTYVQKVDRWFYLTEKNLGPLRANGIDAARFLRSFNGAAPGVSESFDRRAARVRYGIPESAFTLVLASRAVPEKGWRIAIDIARRIHGLKRDIHLMLAGEGPMADELREACSGESFVTFAGHVDDAAPLLAACDLALFPSTFAGESFPLFLLECLSVGLPILSTEMGEIPSMFGPDEQKRPGRLFPSVLSSDELATAMAEVVLQAMEDPALLGKWRQNAQRAVQRFDIEKLIDLYESTFHELIAQS